MVVTAFLISYAAVVIGGAYLLARYYDAEVQVTDIVVKNVDVPMLREQRDALIAAIEDVEDISTWGDSETMKFREKQVESLDGIVNLLDAMIDNAEGFGD
tara:strand:+ start:221 stop:520 length:300 start_codon:yes stop_codon:yes gene_type:complete